jgi:hypothetical protein
MESIRGDPELASEMVVLLGRELKSARKTISDLKERLEQNVGAFYSSIVLKYFLT